MPAIPNLRRSLDQPAGIRQHLKHASIPSHPKSTQLPKSQPNDQRFANLRYRALSLWCWWVCQRLSPQLRKVNKVRSHPRSRSLNGEAIRGYSRSSFCFSFCQYIYLNSKLNELEARHSHEGLHGCAWQKPSENQLQWQLETWRDHPSTWFPLISHYFPTVSEFWMDLASSHDSVHHSQKDQKANLRG